MLVNPAASYIALARVRKLAEEKMTFGYPSWIICSNMRSRSRRPMPYPRPLFVNEHAIEFGDPSALLIVHDASNRLIVYGCEKDAALRSCVQFWQVPHNPLKAHRVHRITLSWPVGGVVFPMPVQPLKAQPASTFNVNITGCQSY